MTTKIRPSTIVLALLILSWLGTMIFVAVKNLVSNIQIFRPSLLFFISILFISGVFCAIHFTLIIINDLKNRKITFYYPFRFVRRTYHYSEIIGFRFKYLPSRFIDYKAIQIKTYDGKRYAISDFETSNLREIQKIAIDNFELAGDKYFSILNQSQKEAELQKSYSFDMSQSRSLRDLYFLIAIACGVLIFIFINSLTKKTSPPVIDRIVLLMLICVCFIVALFKFFRTNNKIKNGL